MSTSLSRGHRAVIAVVTGALVVTACGGTRVADEAIQAAAGVRVADAAAGGGAPNAGPSATAPDTLPVATGTVNGGTAGAGAAGPDTTDAPRAATSTGSGNDVAAATADRPAAARASSGATVPTPAVRLGAVGTFSGPVGSLVKDTVTGLRVWSQAVNAAGGVDGHPIDLLVGDDGGDPARYYSIQKQFVEQHGVLAFLVNTVAYAPAGNNTYLDSERIYTFGTDGGLELPYQNPYVLTATPAGYTLADAMIPCAEQSARREERAEGRGEARGVRLQ